MKKSIFILLLLVSSNALADGYRHGSHGYGHHRHHISPPVYTPYYVPPAPVYYTPGYYYNPPVVIQSYPSASDVLLPMMLGGVIGYAIGDSKSESRSTSDNSSSDGTKWEATYRYQTIHDAECDCDKKVLVKVD